MGKWSKEMVIGRKPRGTVKRWLKTVRRSRDQGLGRQMVETGGKKIGTVRAEEGGCMRKW